MNSSVYSIDLTRLLIMLVPVACVAVVYMRWSLKAGNVLYAVARMVIQLLLIGYVLVYIFETDNALIVCAILSVMLIAASWIALGPLRQKSRARFGHALMAISLSGVTMLALVTQGVIGLDPWYRPQYMIPLAGMIFANCMNAVSLAAERMESAEAGSLSLPEVQATALRASLIPITNSLFAVGLVSLPGMMTGQILSGVSPLIAARYQIMVMCMIFGSSGLAAWMYLSLAGRSFRETQAG